MIRILAACSPGEVRIAVERDADLIDYALWRPGAPDGIGDIVAGIVQASNPAMGGAFVALPGNRSGFLPTRDALPDGTRLIVRITRAAQGGKGVRLARADSPADADADAARTSGILQRGPSPLETLAARYPEADIVVDSPAVAATLPRALRPRITRSLAPAFDAMLEADVTALGAPDIMLTRAIRATIDPTTALVAIDLDWSGTGGAQAQFAANVDAFAALATQIRLRSLSGAILIDPAGLGTRKRHALVAPLRAALADDPQNAQCLGATGLGLLEIVRTRVTAPLHELLQSPHGIGLDALRQTLRARPEGRIVRPHGTDGHTRGQPDANADPTLRGASPTLRVSLPVARALEADPTALATFASDYGAPLRLLPNPDYPTAYWSFAP